jgi:ABC-2 type transport system permease protein
MRWLRLARTDVADARRNRTLYVVLGLFVLTGALGGYILGRLATLGFPGSLTFPVLVLQAMSVLVPLVALSITYDAVVDKRADGTLALLLGLPYLRRDVALGTYVGRFVITALGTVVGVATIAVVGVVVAGEAALAGAGQLGFALALVFALVAVFTGIGLALSLSTRSSTLAVGGAFLVLVAFVFLWGALLQLLVFVVNGFTFSGPQPEWVPFLHALNPVNAFKALASTRFLGFEGIGGLLTSGATFYQTELFASVVMAGWAVLVPLAGFLRFQRSDL